MAEARTSLRQILLRVSSNGKIIRAILGRLARRPCRPDLVLALTLALQQSANADASSDLLFFSGDLISGRGYGGAGWMHAFSGLDSSGAIFSLEGGRPEGVEAYGAGQAGWRFVQAGLYVTLMGGLEAEPHFHPLGSADLWWEPSQGWMVQGRYEASSDWVSWRLAAGWRPSEAWPWLGPEAASSAAWPRVGLHATGVKLPAEIEARVSAGVSWGRERVGPYCEVSLWRRF
jgi:Cellulose biosynthesis protein BcsS